jgi:predicted dehydrogenase
MQRIRTAIIGYGRSGSQMHAGAIEANAPFHLVAVCDLDPARRQQASERFHCALYEDYHQMLARERLDLAIIVTRSDQHCQMTCDCLAAGVNVLVTKPWAVDAAEGRRMMAAEAKSGKRLFPWLPARWGCELQRLRQLLAEQAIGNVFCIRRAVCSFGTRCDWQTERRYGGGYLLNWGAHIIDPPILLKGSPVRTVYGRLKQTINPGDVEDLFSAHLTLADGTLVQAEYTVATIDLPHWFLQGDRGTIEIRGRQLTVSRKTPDRPDDPTRFSTMKAEGQAVTTEQLTGATWGDEKVIYAELAGELRQAGRYPIASADALALSTVFDAIRQSSVENRLVTL